jgi:hypothetical protein
MMKTLLITASALGMLAISAPAAAQYSQPTYQNQMATSANANVAARIEQLQLRLDTGLQTGAISPAEAAPLRQQIRSLRRTERLYSRNGLSGQEVAALQQSIRSVRQQLRAADNGANGRYNDWDRQDAYGYGNQNNGYGNTGGLIDQNRDGWDDRDYNRNGRLDDDNVGQPYQQGYAQGYPQPVQQGGIGGLINQVLGVGGLQVGQRVTSNLGAVPYQYQGQYRDGNGVYYRSDGRQIYQVDARSQTVVRVFPM